MKRHDQTWFLFPLAPFDPPPRPPAAPAPADLEPDIFADIYRGIPLDRSVEGMEGCIEDLGGDTLPELRTVYDDDHRAPDVDAEDETDPPEET
jgi:hypothetical protein